MQSLKGRLRKPILRNSDDAASINSVSSTESAIGPEPSPRWRAVALTASEKSALEADLRKRMLRQSAMDRLMEDISVRARAVCLRACAGYTHTHTHTHTHTYNHD